MLLFLWILIFAVSLAVLIKGSDYFIESAEIVGLYLGMPSFIIGIVIVGIGTSLPELVTSINSVFQNSSEIVVSNVIGSNITNIFLVLGVAGVISKGFTIDYNLLKTDIPFLLASALMLTVMLWDGAFSLGEAILCLIGLVLYIYYSLHESNPLEGIEKPKKPGIKPWIVIAISPLFIWLGADFAVRAIQTISGLLNIGTEIISFSAVALGTSLPELMVTISATKKGKPEIAVGNIVGSNIFNTFAVMGIPGLITTLTIPAESMLMPLLLFVTATLLFIIITIDKKVQQLDGWILLVFYVFYIGSLYKVI